MIQIVGPQLSQWDTGRSVQITGYEVEYAHFANKGDSKAVIMGVVDIDAKIPDYLLQTGKELCVYAVKDGITLERKTFSVKKRERPENYVYEEDQRNYIYTLIQSAEEATEAAYIAVESAEQATQEATNAAGNADNAAEAANRAAQSAVDASETANEAAIKAKQTAKSLMVVGKAEGSPISLEDAIDQYLVGLRIFGKTTQDGTPTPDAPVELVSVGNNGFIKTTVASKNLLAEPFVIGVHRQNGYASNHAGVISTKGIYLKAGTYAVSCSGVSDYYMYVNGMTDATHTSDYQANYLKVRVIKILEDGLYNLQFNKPTGETFTDAELQVVNASAQLEVGTVATAYEPYKGKTLTVSTPNGLPGISVISGGNYTDANGQQWVCDEIDFAKGVYVQRIGVIESYAGEVVAGAFMSSTGELTTGASVQYVLNAPVETPLSAEELAAYASLHTYRGNTTVSNDASAHMEIEYVMDAKKYIDSLVQAPPAKLTNVTLLASKWVGSNSLYSQVVTIPGITEYSKVDLLPSVEQLAIFFNKNVAFVTENEDGVVTVYAIGDKPTLDYTMQAQITEVVA